MRTFFISSLFIAVSQLLTPAHAAFPTDREIMLQQLEDIRLLIYGNYSLREVKEAQGWKFEQGFDSLRARVQRGMQPFVFRRDLAALLRSAADLHLELGVSSSAQSFLSFRVRSVIHPDGKRTFHLVWKDDRDPGFASVRLGDELVTFNGAPVIEELRTLQNLDRGTPGTWRRAEELLTWRPGYSGFYTPVGEVKLQFRSDSSGGALIEVVTPWLTISEGVPLPGEPVPPVGGIANMKSPPQTPWNTGARFGYLPPLSRPLWMSDRFNTWLAYEFEDQGHRYGYLRLHDFKTRDPRRAIEDLAQIISKFEDETEGLLVDISANPGGDIAFSYAAISLLIDQPIPALKFRRQLGFDDIMKARLALTITSGITDDNSAKRFLGPDFYGYPITYKYAQTMKTEAEAALETWQKGQRLTPPGSVESIAVIEPYPVVAPQKRYSKPILLWVDEGSRSSADFFAAIMKDSGRARLVGTHSAGAGGRVRSISTTNLIGIQNISITDSYAIRVNGSLIEGVGVEPDVFWSVSAEDIRGGFASTRQILLSEIAANSKPAPRRRIPVYLAR